MHFSNSKIYEEHDSALRNQFNDQRRPGRWLRLLQRNYGSTIITMSLYIFIFTFNSCTNTVEKQSSKSDTLKQPLAVDTNSRSQLGDSLFFVSSGQMSRFKTINMDNITFQLVRDNKNDTSFIGTWDKSFVTPEGYSVGMSLRQIKKGYRNKIQEEPGWGYYIQLPSKWNLQFCIGQTATDHAPADSDSVTYIFQRR